MVEWKKLGNLCIIKTGKLNANAQVEDGEYPFFTCDANPYRIDNYAFDTEALLLSGNGSQVGHLNYYKGKFNAYQRTYVLDCLCGIDIFYLYHYMKGTIRQYVMNKSKKGSVPYITLPMIVNFEVPVPDISEQKKIVDKLNTFTSSIENLKVQIALRRKQYEYYRDQLLDLEGKEGTEMKIADFCLLKAGKSISSEDITENESDNSYPCIGGNGKRGYVSYFSHEGAYPIIGRQGALCGCVNWITGKFYATEHAVVAKGSAFMDQRFLFYLFENANLNQYKTQGAQPGLSVAKLNEVRFIIPPLQEQQRIVNILDTFEESIQNLEAQLAQREKQYEYYRNKLLTFE